METHEFVDLLQFAGIASLAHSGHVDNQRPGGIGAGAGAAAASHEEVGHHASDILETTSYELKLDKSNILMLGPTGTG
jgi:hypothetical protein